MDFVGNSYNGYLVTDQKMDGDTLLIKVDGVDGVDGGFDAIMERVKLHN